MTHIILYTLRKLGGLNDTHEFDGCIKKLSDQSGVPVPHKESEFKKSPKLQAKEGYVLLIFTKDGKKGVSLYSKPFITNQKKFETLVSIMIRSTKYSSLINRVELYKVNHPVVSSMSAKRSAKQLSWQYVDDETILEVQRKGKMIITSENGDSTLGSLS